MIYIAICDDDKEIVEMLEQRVRDYLAQDKVIFELKVYTNSMTLQYDIQEGTYFDIILSDIEMPDIDGMKLASYVKKYLPNAYVIFITSHMKYTLDAFELSIFRYVPKTDMDTRLRHALKDVIEIVKIQTDRSYCIQTSRWMKKIAYQEILYIQRNGKNSVIQLVDNTSVKVRKSLNKVFKELKPDFFIYVDRGTIVNLTHIIGVRDGMVELKNKVYLQTSLARLEQIKNMLSKFWGSKI